MQPGVVLVLLILIVTMFDLLSYLATDAKDEDVHPEIDAAMEKVAGGRPLHTIQLFKPENQSLGFSVVGITKAENEGQLGIYVQGIQPGGIAHQ